jgi:hypothetical protein
MENIVQDQPLPPEAARQESLLPVWRIRLARAASSHLDHPEPQVRAAAVRAWALLRGSGAGPKVEQVLDAGPDDRVAAAAIFAISRIHPMPLRTLDRFTAPDSPAPALARTAALEGTVHVFLQRVRALPQDMTPAFVIDRLTAATADSDFVVAATGAELLAGYPSRQTVIALAELWDRASGPESADLRLAVMGALQAMGPAVAALERPDTTGYGVDHLLEITRDLLREAFDAADLRLRNRGREAALATGLLPDNLIPSEASLLATLPAFRRSAEQAQLVLPFDAPEVRCVTDRGSFTIALDADIAPNTCASFLTPVILVSFLLFFLLGFFLYATLYAGVGAMCNSVQDSQQFGYLNFGLILPMVMLPLVMENPNSPLVTILSLVPLFSPVLMFMRVCLETPPVWQILLSWVLMAGSIWITSRAAGKLFRVGILMYGASPTWASLVRALRV